MISATKNSTGLLNVLFSPPVSRTLKPIGKNPVFKSCEGIHPFQELGQV